MDCRLCPRPPVLSVKWLRPGSEECKMATEGSNLHDDGGGRTDNRPAYSCHSRQKAGSILEEEPRRAAGGTTNRSHPATAAACSLSKASGVVEPVATNCTRPPDPSLTSDKVTTAPSVLNATFLSFLIIFSLFFCNFGYHCNVMGRM